MLVMNVMIKSVPAKNLAAYLVSDAGLIHEGARIRARICWRRSSRKSPPISV
jgi:hypothetical protein